MHQEPHGNPVHICAQAAARDGPLDSSATLPRGCTDTARLGGLQESGVHSIVPLAALQQTPLAGAVAAIDLREALGGLPDFPEGTTRFVVTVDGTETADEIRSLEARRPHLFRKEQPKLTS